MTQLEEHLLEIARYVLPHLEWEEFPGYWMSQSSDQVAFYLSLPDDDSDGDPYFSVFGFGCMIQELPEDVQEELYSIYDDLLELRRGRQLYLQRR